MEQCIIREIKLTDIENGLLDILKIHNKDKTNVINALMKIINNPDHIILVAEYNDTIIGCITLFIEIKFIHNGGLVCHIEDIYTKDIRSEISSMLITEALKVSKDHGCYKSILDCSDMLNSFYEKFGFKRFANSMKIEYSQ